MRGEEEREREDTKRGDDESRERIIIRKFEAGEKWQSAEKAFCIMEEIARHGFDPTGDVLYGPMISARFLEGFEKHLRFFDQFFQCVPPLTSASAFAVMLRHRLPRARCPLFPGS